MAAADTAVVTGASSGIGEAIAASLLERGIPVVTLQRSPPKLKHKDLHFRPVDLTDLAGDPQGRERRRCRISRALPRQQCRRERAQSAGKCDGRGAQLRSSPSRWAPRMVLIQSFVPGMRRAKFGRIVNISSRAILGKSERIVYASAKSGLEGMTRVVAIETGADGITVNSVMPGPVETAHFNRGHPVGSVKRQTVIDKVLVGRLGTPQDVAHAVDVPARPRERLHHRPVAVRLRRHQRHRHGRRMMARLRDRIDRSRRLGHVSSPRRRPVAARSNFAYCVGRNPERLAAFARDTGIPARENRHRAH